MDPVGNFWGGADERCHLQPWKQQFREQSKQAGAGAAVKSQFVYFCSFYCP
jgi:hypothetical protein